MGTISRYELLGQLGSGGFATVWKVKRKTDSQIFALKKVACDNLDEANGALSEARMLLDLRSPHIVRYHDFFLTEEMERGGKKKMFVCHIMDFCSSGDLFQKLEGFHKRRAKIPVEDIRDWTSQLLTALDYLESKRIVHRDIKLANILFEGNVLKLGDFGISKQLTAAFARTVMGGTPLYMAPELLLKERYDTKADVWAFGCLVYELATCSLLSMKKDGVMGALVVKKGNEVLEQLFSEISRAGYDASLVELVRNCLVVEAQRRLSPSELLRLPFYNPSGRGGGGSGGGGSAGFDALTRATEVGSRAYAAAGSGGGGGGQRGGMGLPANMQDLPPEMRLYHQYQQKQQQQLMGDERGGRMSELAMMLADPRMTADDMCRLADQFDREQKCDEAEICFKKAIEANPQHARALCNFGYFQQTVKKDMEQAEKLFRASLAVDPHRTPTLCNYAYLLKAMKREREAREVFKTALKLDPTHPWVTKNKQHFT